MARINAAIATANVKLMKLGKALNSLKEAIESTGSSEPVDLVKFMHPEWGELTKDEFDGKVWYIREMLMPKLKKKAKDVFEEIYQEEEAKLLDSEEVIDKYSW